MGRGDNGCSRTNICNVNFLGQHSDIVTCIYFAGHIVTYIFCRSFGGKPTPDDYMNELQTLADQIGDSSKYENAFYFFAGYDSPYKVSDRHNEVWLKAL